MNLRTPCATAGLARQMVSGKPGWQPQLGVEGGLTTRKKPKKPHGQTAVLAGLIPFSSLPQPWSHLLHKSPVEVHDQGRRMGRQREPAHCQLVASALVGPSLVAGSSSPPCCETSSVGWQEHDHPQMHQQPALLQEWSDLPRMKACVHTCAVSLHGEEDTCQPLSS